MSSDQGSISGLPTLDWGLVHGHRGGVVEMSAIQLLDLRGGPTEPIGVRSIEVEVAADPSGGLHHSGEHPTEVTARVDPLTGQPLGDDPEARICVLDEDTTETVQAVRRFARARFGVNRRSSMMRRGWEPGNLLSRRQIFPLDPGHLVWFRGAAWMTDEVYCVNPTCPCQDLYLDFEELLASGRSGPKISALIDLSTWEVKQSWGRGPARELATAWLQQPGARERGRALFDQAHAVGEELLDPFAARKGVVNPDSRCPCGSRRKYKRCCMGARPPRVPGDLHALKARARTALTDFALEELGEPLRLTDADDPVVVPSEESRWAWLLYWRRFDGFTLADRFLSDPDRGDVWLRRWLEAASGTPPGAFEVMSADGRSARLAGLADLDGADRDVQLANPDEIRVGEVVFGAPVRLMGRAVMEGAWTIPGSKHVGLDLAQELKSVRHETDRLRWPERVLQAVFEVAADGEAS